MSNVKMIKLITGEDVIGNVSKNGNIFDIKDPVRIGVTPQGVAMADFNPFIKDKSIKIEDKHVIYLADLEEEVLNAYNSKYGSGIVVAGSGLQLEM